MYNNRVYDITCAGEEKEGNGANGDGGVLLREGDLPAAQEQLPFTLQKQEQTFALRWTATFLFYICFCEPCGKVRLEGCQIFLVQHTKTDTKIPKV
jgi:hypothetical protein